MPKLITLLFFISFFSTAFSQIAIVSTNYDSGPGSLRQAILDCNSNSSISNIIIDLPDNDVIFLFSSLPDYTSNALISSNTMVYVNGNYMSGPGIRAISFDLATVSKLQFINFGANTFYVTNTNDNGLGSLRQAIKDANTTDIADNIYFNIPGIAPHTISLSTSLSNLTYPVTIDGTTQALNGYIGNSPGIKLMGNSTFSGLKISSSYVSLFGLSLTGFTNAVSIESYPFYSSNLSYITIGNSQKRNVISGNENGIEINSACQDVTIENNYIGTDINGLTANPNTNAGIYASQITDNVTIKNNLISGNSNGIYFSGCSMLNIEGNKIGVDISGNQALSNVTNGIELWSNGTVNIGGTITAKRNIISGNNSGSNTYTAGIASFGIINYLSIKGNYIGVNSTGTNSIPNKNGILIQDTIRVLEIGNGSASGRNIISGNNQDGVYIKYNTNNIIDNNYIGTDVTGENKVPNLWNGIVLQNVTHSTIQKNILSGNLKNGLHLYSLNTKSNSIFKNIIGSNASKNKDLGNGYSGIYIQNNSTFHNNKIGDYTIQNANLIANNKRYGIITSYYSLPTDDFNLFSYNTFYNNTLKGIFLETSTGQEYPVPTIGLITANKIKGTASPNDSVQIYYSQLSDLHPQGKTYIATVLADISGAWTYNGNVNIDSVITCIAVNSSTQFSSEFSVYDPGAVCISKATNQTVTICAGDSVTVGKSIYYNLGVYQDVFFNTYGCDSTVTTNVIVLNPVVNQIDTVLIGGQSVDINGVNYSQMGIYTDTLTGINSCDSILYITIELIDGIKNLNLIQSVSVYPNPSSEYITICSKSENLITFSLVNSLGEIILTDSFRNKKNIDISKFPKGTYTLRGFDESDRFFIQKVVLM